MGVVVRPAPDIGVYAHINAMMSFNTTGMGRGDVGPEGKPPIKATTNDDE